MQILETPLLVQSSKKKVDNKIFNQRNQNGKITNANLLLNNGAKLLLMRV